MSTWYSTQMTNLNYDSSNPVVPVVPNAQGSYLFRIPWDYTHTSTTAVAENDTIEICEVPAGCKVILPMSVLKLSAAQGTAALIDIGYKAYKDKNGATIAADADGLVNGMLASVTTVNTLIPATHAPVGTQVDTLGVMDFTDAVENVKITLFAEATSDFDGDTGDIYKGYFVVEMGGN